MIGGNNFVSLAPTVNISFDGGSRGDKAADTQLADQIGKTVKASLSQMIADELRRQMRSRGMFNM